jgi:hypothetical protein
MPHLVIFLLREILMIEAVLGGEILSINEYNIVDI